jgi:hypothetical protein
VIVDKKMALRAEASSSHGLTAWHCGIEAGAEGGRRRRKKKGRTEVRPKFREEKPEGLAMGSGRSGVAPQDEFSPENVNKWLTSSLF